MSASCHCQEISRPAIKRVETPTLQNKETMMRKRWMRVFFRKADRGGAAVEYIMVSVFGLLLAVAAIAFVRQAVQGRVAALEERLGISMDDSGLQVFGD